MAQVRINSQPPQETMHRVGTALVIGGVVALALSMLCLGLAHRLSVQKDWARYEVTHSKLTKGCLALFFPGLILTIWGAGLRACAPKPPRAELRGIQ